MSNQSPTPDDLGKKPTVVIPPPPGAPDHLENAFRRMEDAHAAIRSAYIFEKDPLMSELLMECSARAKALHDRLKRYNALARHR